MNFFFALSAGPNPVSNIAPLVDSNNVTLEWPRPDGRVETYIVKWEESSNPTKLNSRNVTQSQNDTGPVRILVGDLIPGVEYTFYIQAVSYDLESDTTTLKTRTSKYVIKKNNNCIDNLFFSALNTIGSSSSE